MFDEATSALDNETESKLTEVLESFRGQLTTSHRPPAEHRRRCDRLLYLEQGKLVADGTFSELDRTIPGVHPDGRAGHPPHLIPSPIRGPSRPGARPNSRGSVRDREARGG